jgi:5'-nucleotidase
MKPSILAAAIAIVAVGCTGAADLPTERAQRNFDVCSQFDDDSAELRERAAGSVRWRDPNAANPQAWRRFKILGFNDFHGALQRRTLSGRPVGGADVLASYLAAEAAQSPRGALIVHAGDHVGATPPVSSLLQDEPAIAFLNLLANPDCDARGAAEQQCNLVGTLGNHEFDEGVGEMVRLIGGGNHPSGPFLDDPWAGARFPYVNANVVGADSGKPILPPYVIRRVDGMPVAFIGIVLKTTPSIVTPAGVAGLRFLDEAETVNRYVPELKASGVRAIVVMIHQGTRQNSFGGRTPDEAVELGADIGPIVRALDDEIDIVVSGHYHQFTNALMNTAGGRPVLVTQAFANGTAYADIDVAIDPVSRDIVEKSAEIVTTWADQGPGLTPDVRVGALVNDAATLVQPLVEKVIGVAANELSRTENAAGESALGNLIADAQRAAMGTDIALMNPGGIRTDIAAGAVTWGELFSVQPFGNDLVRMDLSGAQLIALLNQQWAGQSFARVMKGSGIAYAWNGKATATHTDDEVIAASVKVNGIPLDPSATYSVTVNSFMASGGDNLTVLTQGSNRVVGPVDLQALIEYVRSLPQPFTATIEGRIQRVD